MARLIDELYDKFCRETKPLNDPEIERHATFLCGVAAGAGSGWTQEQMQQVANETLAVIHELEAKYLQAISTRAAT